MSRSFFGEPTRDWTKGFMCPKCEDGQLRFKKDAWVCDKCDHEIPLELDNTKFPRIMDG